MTNVSHLLSGCQTTNKIYLFVTHKVLKAHYPSAIVDEDRLLVRKPGQRKFIQDVIVNSIHFRSIS